MIKASKVLKVLLATGLVVSNVALVETNQTLSKRVAQPTSHQVYLEVATEDGTDEGVWINPNKVKDYTQSHGGGDVVYINGNYTELIY